MRYIVRLTTSARKEALDLDDPVYERVRSAIDRLQEEPRPFGVRRLKGRHNVWRIRVGDYRVVYEIDDARGEITISHIKHRRDAYRH